MNIFKLTRDKIELDNCYIILNTLLSIELDSLGKVINVKTICTTNDEVSFAEATEEIKLLPQRKSRKLSKSEFDELVELYKNNIKEFQTYQL